MMNQWPGLTLRSSCTKRWHCNRMEFQHKQKLLQLQLGLLRNTVRRDFSLSDLHSSLAWLWSFNTKPKNHRRQAIVPIWIKNWLIQSSCWIDKVAKDTTKEPITSNTLEHNLSFQRCSIPAMVQHHRSRVLEIILLRWQFDENIELRSKQALME